MGINSDLFFPERYLKGTDVLRAKNGEVTLTICDVMVESVQGTQGRSEDCIVIFFHETREKAQREGIKPDDEKRYILTRPVKKVLTAMYGADTDGWIDKPVTIYTEHGRWFGKETDAIRVKLIRPEGELP